MKLLSCLCFIMSLINCSSIDKFRIEEEQPLKFKEAYFEEWVSGVKGGGSGLNIFLYTEKKAAHNDIMIEGIYFNNSYAILKFYQPNKYQGYIKTERNNSGLISEINEKKADVNSKQKEKKIPFILGENEAVISYTKNKKKKYFKITMVKREMKNLPM